MQKNQYKIGITCIGSGVGQSIINSCSISNLPLYTIGLGNNPFAYGAYDCDTFDHIPSIYAPDYIPVLIEKYHQYGMDLLIPSLDDEVLLLSENIDQLLANHINLILPDKQIARICRNKKKMSDHFPDLINIFVRSIPRSDIISGKIEFPIIAKPVSGSSSRGIKIIHSKEDIAGLDDSYFFQEIAFPGNSDINFDEYAKSIESGQLNQLSEISIQLVLDKNGDLLGKMASINKLINGVPIEILPIDSQEIWKPVESLLPFFRKYGLRGPLNLQSRLTENGLKIFEMNARFTGITGLRAVMGFNEVEACICNWLNLGQIPLQINPNKFGLRQVANKAISLDRNRQVRMLSNKIKKSAEKNRKIILVTGTSGLLGTHLLSELSNPEYEIWTINRTNNRKENFPSYIAIQDFTFSDFENGKINLGMVDILVHLAFAREKKSKTEIAESLQLSTILFRKAFQSQIPAIINISSQSVYGKQESNPWQENFSPAPETAYAQAKYAVELNLSTLGELQKQTRFTSLRLPTLTGGEYKFDPNELIYKLCSQILKEGRVTIFGGQQILERMDVRDAAKGINALINLPPTQWKPLYNLGVNRTLSITDTIKQITARIQSTTSISDVEILFKDTDIDFRQGMNSEPFIKDADWSPGYSLEDSVDAIVNHLLKTR